MIKPYTICLAVICLLAAIGYGLLALYHAGYHAGANQVQVQWDADKIARANAEKAALLAYAEKLKQAQEQYDHDQDTITRLAADASRMRIHLPTCGDNAAQAAADPDQAAGVLPDRVDQLFAGFQDRVGSLIRECDVLNAQAIRANGSR